MKSFIRKVERWQMPLVLAVVAVAALGVLSYKELSQKPPAAGKQINQITDTKLSVIGASSVPLSTGSSAVEVPTANSSSPLQSQDTNPGEASSSPLQSNANINSPAVANSPLVQSLLTESSN